MSPGQSATGGSASLTVTRKVHEAVLPAASVAVQVTVVVPTGNVDPDAGVQVIVAPGQLSVTVEVYVTTASHEPGSLPTAISPGHVATGSSVSLTVTVNEHVSALPATSVAIQVTVVAPSANVEPEAGVQAIDAPGQLSVTEELKVTAASHDPISLLTVKSPEHVATGGSVSSTVIVNEQVSATPQAFVAIQVTVVVPIGNVDPEAGVQTAVEL